MKTTKICPKCGSNDIIKIEGTAGAYGAGNNIPVTWTKYAMVDRYLCGSCGYSEEWVERDSIEKIRKKYAKEVR
jgi:ribosomal protein S27AE